MPNDAVDGAIVVVGASHVLKVLVETNSQVKSSFGTFFYDTTIL